MFLGSMGKRFKCRIQRKPKLYLTARSASPRITLIGAAPAEPARQRASSGDGASHPDKPPAADNTVARRPFVPDRSCRAAALPGNGTRRRAGYFPASSCSMTEQGDDGTISVIVAAGPAAADPGADLGVRRPALRRRPAATIHRCATIMPDTAADPRSAAVSVCRPGIMSARNCDDRSLYISATRHDVRLLARCLRPMT